MQMIWGGSAKKLLGNCLAVGIFVSEGEDAWTEESKQATWDNVEKGMEWIRNTGSEEYDASISFECLCLNREEDVVLDKIPRYGDDYSNTEEMLTSVVEQLGYDDLIQFYQGIKEDYEDYNIHIMFLFNVESRAHMNYIRIDDPIEKLEFNNMYKSSEYSESDGETVLADSMNIATIVHESLHAYGAMDLYNVYESPEGEEAEKRLTKRFSSEIMLTTSNELEESEISEFTAFLLGWHNEPETWYKTIVQPFDKEALVHIMKNHEHFDDEGNLIINEEEEILRYTYDEGTFSRFKINGSNHLVHWKQYLEESEEEIEFWENMEDDNFYYVTGKDMPDSFSIPKASGGLAHKAEKFAGTYEEWFEMEVEET